MIAGRFLQGAAGGVMLICQVAVLTSQFSDPAQRVRAFAAWGVVFGIGLGFGPIIGSAIVALAIPLTLFVKSLLIDRDPKTAWLNQFLAADPPKKQVEGVAEAGGVDLIPATDAPVTARMRATSSRWLNGLVT